MHLWRISNYADLSGRGGLLAPGRWHHQGHPVVYCSDHPATAMLEVLVHFEPEDLPDSYQLLKITCPDDISIFDLDPEAIDITDIEATQAFGSDFIKQSRHCLLSIPSAIMPVARNYLINPAHELAKTISIETVARYPFDKRLK